MMKGDNNRHCLYKADLIGIIFRYKFGAKTKGMFEFKKDGFLNSCMDYLIVLAPY